MKKVDNLILGAGIAGLAAAKKLSESNKEYLILEKRESYGGLCDNFIIDGFLFDRFVHLSFTEDSIVKKFFDKVNFYTHIPNPESLYNKKWLKHPAQNNLFPLSAEEKKKIWNDLLERDKFKNKVENYEDWLYAQFGKYFSDNFSKKYTRKYWGVEATELETKWIGERIYQPTLCEIKEGMHTKDTPVTYYAKEMRYPKQGGYKSFLSGLVDDNYICYNEEVIEIDLKNKYVKTNKKIYKYKHLISSIPLKEYKYLIRNLEKKVVEAMDKLHTTSSYIISLGFRGELKKSNLWNYIYDEDILPARIYSPSEKSKSNCPKGCSSLQAEIYFKDDNIPKVNKEQILLDVINQLHEVKIINKHNILVKDIRFERYANVIFDKNIYEARDVVREFLNKQGIITIGRFGEWEYFWSDQSFMSGYTNDM